MWTKEDIKHQIGKTAIITGGNSGIGYEMALALYEAGAHVVIAGRNPDKVNEAVETINTMEGKGSVEAGILDLSNLNKIRQFADDFKSKHQRLDILINNAGVMMPPPSLTDDGYELQFGTNFLGHFALTGYLYPLLKQTQNARIITLSSGAHKWAKGIDYENLKSEKSYDPNREYGISKLADLLFTIELQRRIDSKGDSVYSLGAHPGITRTDLQRHIDKSALDQYKTVMQPWQGALPALYAATADEAQKGGYYGPDGENELTGYPAPAVVSEVAQNESEAKQLWHYAEKETGIIFP